jgi:uncharacterized protein YceH (UPF0502 family)
MEKQLSTPEYYPLTLNALVAACNQKSNREPVMELSEPEVQRALDRLQDEKLVWRRGRSDRLQSFDTVAEVEEILRDMSTHSEPLVRELTRRPGQKEERWAHTTGGAIVETAPEPGETHHEVRGEPLAVRVQRLEEQVAALANALSELKTKLGE